MKLFTRPCDGVYDHNEVVVARARSARIPVQMSRIQQADLDALHAAHGRDWALVVAGYPWLIRGWRGRAGYALNIHPSPLPTGRGPYPLFRAVLDRYETWGVTAHVLAEDGFDTGTSWPRTSSPSRLPRRTRRSWPNARWRPSASPPVPWPGNSRRAGSGRSRRATVRTGPGRMTATAPSIFARTWRPSCAGAGLRHRRDDRPPGDQRAYVAEAQGWQEAHSYAPGTSSTASAPCGRRGAGRLHPDPALVTPVPHRGGPDRPMTVCLASSGR